MVEECEALSLTSGEVSRTSVASSRWHVQRPVLLAQPSWPHNEAPIELPRAHLQMTSFGSRVYSTPAPPAKSASSSPKCGLRINSWRQATSSIFQEGCRPAGIPDMRVGSAFSRSPSNSVSLAETTTTRNPVSSGSCKKASTSASPRRRASNVALVTSRGRSSRSGRKTAGVDEWPLRRLPDRCWLTGTSSDNHLPAAAPDRIATERVSSR